MGIVCSSGPIRDLGNLERYTARLRASGWLGVFEGAASGCRKCCELIVTDGEGYRHGADEKSKGTESRLIERSDRDICDARQSAGIRKHFNGDISEAVDQIQRLLGREFESCSLQFEDDRTVCMAHDRFLDIRHSQSFRGRFVTTTIAEGGAATSPVVNDRDRTAGGPN
jgi:hypothetical protein